MQEKNEEDHHTTVSDSKCWDSLSVDQVTTAPQPGGHTHQTGSPTPRQEQPPTLEMVVSTTLRISEPVGPKWLIALLQKTHKVLGSELTMCPCTASL